MEESIYGLIAFPKWGRLISTGSLSVTRAVNESLFKMSKCDMCLNHAATGLMSPDMVEWHKVVFALINEENKFICARVIKYLVQEKLEIKVALKLWRTLLAYREDMVQAYGDRVSLHIACYHLTRDPDTLEKASLPSDMRCTRTAQDLAIQELKAWWERCNQSGAHLKEVMGQQLERMDYRANKNNQLLSFVLINIQSQKKDEITTQMRSFFARRSMDSCRSRDSWLP